MAKFDATVTAKFDKQANVVDGMVVSTKVPCQANRTVNLRLRASDGSSTVAGSDLTDSLGAWAIRPPATGTYFAEAAKKVLRKNARHRHVCKPAVSKDVTVK